MCIRDSLDTDSKRSPTDPLRGARKADSQRESGGPLDVLPTPSESPNGAPAGSRQRRRAAERAEGGAERKKEKKYQRRHRLARPSQASWGPWKGAVADAFEAEGWHHAASEIRQCGRQCFTSDCGACGTKNASVRISIHCNLRACPDCARRHAADRARTLTAAALDAMARVAGRAELVIAKLDAQVAEARSAVEYWHKLRDNALRRASKARSSARRDRELASAKAHDGRADAAEHRRSRAQWDRYRAGEFKSWRWSLVTVSPPWDPENPDDLTVAGLRARAADAWQRWDRVWSRLSSGGLAAATARLEASDHAHVHIHALVFGPFVLNETLRGAAGCIVDRPALEINNESYREALADVVREAAKYCLKAGSASRQEWITGDGGNHRSAHPVFAARWTIALHREQTIRYYGTMRAETLDEDEDEGEDKAPVDDVKQQMAPLCPCCGADALLPAVIRLTRDVAREVGAEGWRWYGRESPPAARVAGAGERLPPRVGYCWRVGG